MSDFSEQLKMVNELLKTEEAQSRLYPYRNRYVRNTKMPEKGRDPRDILTEIATMAGEEKVAWNTGKCSGSLYHGGEDHYSFLNQAFGHLSHMNSLQRDMCPSMTRFESEIIAMTLDMLNGQSVKEHNPEHEACGTFTSGGTESIFNGVLVHRDKARTEKGITAPELIMPLTAHPAFNKAAHYLGVKVVTAPIGEDWLVDTDFVEANINENTVLLVGSAGNYPHGLIDPIEKLSDLAIKHDIGLHVDGCLGGFILPWGRQLGYGPIPVFDFQLPGVTSISVDTHKYGYGLKGTSVTLFRTLELRRYLYMIYPDWPGGTYASPGFGGSRSGGLYASTWAAMVAHGKAGYLREADKIFSTAKIIIEGIKTITELEIIGHPTFCIAFRSDVIDIYHVNDYLKSKNWRMNGMQLPDALHFCVTRPQTKEGAAEEFLQVLREGVTYAGKMGDQPPQSGAMYGVGARVDKTMFKPVMTVLMDAIQKA